MNAASPASRLSPIRRAAILASGILSTTLYFTTILVTSTVLPQIQGTMSATADEVSWVVTFNILAIAIATPMAGWLAARFGRRTVMVTCVAGLCVSTLMCGLAQSLESLIFWRIVQGAIGAPTVPLAQSTMLDIFPAEQHRFVMSLNGMGVILGPIIGPTLAGKLAEDLTWRWAFFMLVPVSLISFLGLFFALPKDTRREPIGFDWIGFLSLSTSIGCLQYVLSRGQRLDWLESQEIVVFLSLSGLSFYLFLAHSLTAERPFLNLKLLTDRNLALGLLLVALFGMLSFTPMVLLPTLLRQHAGFPDALVGQVIGARGFGGLAGFFIAMWSERLDPRLSMALGFLALMISGIWLMTVNLDVTPLELALNGMLQGTCIGLLFVPLSIITFSGIEPRYRAEALGVFHLLRNLASSLFISISVAEVVRSTGANYARLVELVNPFNPSLMLPWVVGAWNADTIAGLARISREITRQSAMIAYLNAFGLFTVVAAAAIPFALLFKRAKPAASVAKVPVAELKAPRSQPAGQSPPRSEHIPKAAAE
ncbi:MAG: DHA2 family efflux MFS transporter permease subunit [Hyphomicrobiaceae bacterium]|nr:DHA2 family efflux MFS transporter permease subunit [Hyphomicrobiaceae bacterium]